MSSRPERHPRRSPLLITLGLMAALILPSARADPVDELAGLREEAARLRQSLDQLDARIRALEAQQRGGQDRGDVSAQKSSGTPAAAPEAAAAGVSSLASLKQNWSQVKAGTSEESVQALLGKPARILRIDGNLVWYYAYPGVGQGSVFFTRDGKVSSTQAPTLGWAP